MEYAAVNYENYIFLKPGWPELQTTISLFLRNVKTNFLKYLHNTLSGYISVE